MEVALLSFTRHGKMIFQYQKMSFSLEIEKVKKALYDSLPSGARLLQNSAAAFLFVL